LRGGHDIITCNQQRRRTQYCGGLLGSEHLAALAAAAEGRQIAVATGDRAKTAEC